MLCSLKSNVGTCRAKRDQASHKTKKGTMRLDHVVNLDRPSTHGGRKRPTQNTKPMGGEYANPLYTHDTKLEDGII